MRAEISRAGEPLTAGSPSDGDPAAGATQEEAPPPTGEPKTVPRAHAGLSDNGLGDRQRLLENN